MTDLNISPVERLKRAVSEYHKWRNATRHLCSTGRNCYEPILKDFIVFIKQSDLPWENIFTQKTLEDFQKYSRLTNTSAAVRGLSMYLFRNNKIPQPLKKPNYQIALPDIYEQYMLYYTQGRQASKRSNRLIRRVLVAFHKFLEKRHLMLSSITIIHLDLFMADFYARYSASTCNAYRCILRVFLRYLYQEKKILKRDLSPLLVGPPVYEQASKPPMFLRPTEVQKLFDSLDISTPRCIRAYAMIHLAYYLGLRPQEISQISLDDISFSRAEICLKERKNNIPIKLPLPEVVLKAIAAYMVGSRPKSNHRRLFLSLQPPYHPIGPGCTGYEISQFMRKAGLTASSAYWLRHTYAQNFLETGASIYEIKEMLGHENIDSTRKYLYIHIKLMREVLFHERL